MSSIEFFHSTPYMPNESKRRHPSEVQPIGPKTYLACLGNDRTALNPDDVDLTEIYKSRKAIARSIAFYGNRLAHIDYVSFKYLNQSQREALEEELLNTAYLLYDECRLHQFEKELPRLRERGRQLELCAKLLYRLHKTEKVDDEKVRPDDVHIAVMDASWDKPVQFLALTVIAPLIAETMQQITTGECLERTLEMMNYANIYRLNWVWGGGLDQAILSEISTDWGHTQNAKNVFQAIKPVTGYMSFVLYYLRLGIRLYLLTTGTLKGSWLDPWATAEERAVNMSLRQRFAFQWEKHGVGIINDFFWGTANMACFLWLLSDGVFGCTLYMGNAITALLLLMDLYLTHCQYIKQETEHHAVLEQYENDIVFLEEKIAQEPNAIRKDVLNEHLKVLLEAKETCEHEWNATYENFYSDLVYAVSLLVAFALICCFFFPPAAIVPATALLLGVIGSTLSFVLTIAHNAMATNTEMKQLQRLIDKASTKKEGLEGNLGTEKSLNQRAKLQLEIDNLDKEIIHHNAMIEYHKTKRVQQIFSEAMLPTSVFVFLVFLPLSIGLPAMLPVIALLLLSSSILDWTCKPKDLEARHVDGEPGEPDEPVPCPHQ